MTDPTFYVIMASAGLAGTAMVIAAGLTGWRSWLALKRQELGRGYELRAADAGAGARIEIADLRERVRKLEAIAAGVDL